MSNVAPAACSLGGPVTGSSLTSKGQRARSPKGRPPQRDGPRARSRTFQAGLGGALLCDCEFGIQKARTSARSGGFASLDERAARTPLQPAGFLFSSGGSAGPLGDALMRRPAAYSARGRAEVGVATSYGSDLGAFHRQVGI